MISVNRGYPRVSVMLAPLIGLALMISTTSAQEKLADLKPLVGKWRGHATFQQGTVASDLTILEDGSYTGVVYIKPSVPLAGTIQVVDGAARYKNSEGKTGTFALYVDAKGKTVLKGTRDDGSNTTEYEPLK
jgi:hypothetical protein